MNSRRDGTSPSPTSLATTVHESDSARVGATLVVARVEALHELKTGRDKPVPYKPRQDRA